MEDQLRHYANKLAYETDAWDLDAALKAGENIVVIDARSTDSYEAEHIPGAVSLPHPRMTAESTAGISRDALNMTRLGFRVKELLGGIDWWKRDGYPTEGTEASSTGAARSCGCG